MTELLKNFVGGRWQAGSGAGATLLDPVTGEALVRVDSTGVDLAEALSYARTAGSMALQALSYGERAARLAQIQKLLQSKRDDYYAIATANSGTVRNDSAIDIDGGLYTLGTYAKLGAALDSAHLLTEGSRVRLAKDASFANRHLLVPVSGCAVFINAFNFPAWGLWEKAACALLSGVAVVVKPATATAWLTQRMVADVVASGILPAGALSVVCGRADGLLDALGPWDVLSFTGSAQTAALIRGHQNVIRQSVRTNVEADSLNSAILAPGASDAAIDLIAKEVAREMTIKSGQKCTAIRRVLVPREKMTAVCEAIAARLAKTTVGNPRNESVRMGSLVSMAQRDSVEKGIRELLTETRIVHDGRNASLVDADPVTSACVAPVLLALDDADGSRLIHDTEVFGPVATVVGYRNADHATALARRGQGSLVSSVYADDGQDLGALVRGLLSSHGRVHVVTPAAAAAQSGHGNVMPQSLHGGPGRAGGGEELGGMRGLLFYHRRSVVQAHPSVLDQAEASAASLFLDEPPVA